MKTAEVEKTAKRIYRLIHGKEGWEDSLHSVKAFYRKIARWHLRRLDLQK